MKYNYKLQVVRFVFLLSLIGLLTIENARSQGLLTNTTYIVNGANDYAAPVDTFANLTGSATGPAYGAISYLNLNGMAASQTTVGPVTILLSAGYNSVEPSTINIGNSTGNGGWPNMYWNANSPIVLKPAPGQNFTISSSTVVGANLALVRFNAAWYFTIDGSNDGTPGQRNLTFNIGASSNQGSSRVIDIIPTSGQRIQSVGVKNCVLVGNSTATTANTYAGVYFGGIGAGSSVALAKNINITVTGNLIMAVQYGIYFRGLANAINNQDKNITISDNIIGDYVNPINPANTAFIGGANAAGIYVNTVANAVIDNNIIRNTVGTCPTFIGIFLNNQGGTPGLALDSNIQVTRNRIYNLNNTSSGGITGIRINLGSHTNHLRLLLANNSISKLSAINAQNVLAGFAYPIGILVEDASTLVGLEVFYNSINLTGATLPANAFSACFATSASTLGGIIMMNNSFANSMSRLPNNTIAYTNYNVLITGTVNPFRYTGFNNYYTTTFGGGNAYVGRAKNLDYTSLKGLNLFTSSDTASLTNLPPFKNDSDLTVNTGYSHATWNRAANLEQFYMFYPSVFDSIRFKVNYDINGTIRNNMGRFSAMGCHLWAGDSTNNNVALIAPRTFAINGYTSRPTALNLNGSFATLAEAIDYVNHYGVGGSGLVNLELQPGYNGETAFMPGFIDYPGTNIGRPVNITAQIGFTTTISTPNVPAVNNNSVIRFMGASNVIIDGGSNNRLTIAMPDTNTNNISRVIGITPVDTFSSNITIKNCNIIGNSKPIGASVTNPNTAMGIYVGNPTTAGTPLVALKTFMNNLSFIGNNIFAVRSGIVIMVPGASTATVIKSNIIGGSIPPGTAQRTTYIGGAANQTGILVRGLNNCNIDSNVIRNCISTTALSNGFVGIQIDETGQPITGIFASVTASRNFIYNLATDNGTFCAGIRVYLTAAATPRDINLINNFIGKIVGQGSGLNFSNQNPVGILLDAAGLLTTPGISLAHNTINLTGSGLLNGVSSSAALFVNTNIQGGVAIDNNIFGNRLSRANAAGNRYAVLVGHNASPFTAANSLPFATNNNNYFCEGNFSNFVGANTNGTVNRANINDWRLFTTTAPGPAGSDGNSFNWVNTFKTDTTPDVDLLYAGLVPGGASIVTGICFDIYGNARFYCPGGSTSVTRWVGAAEVGFPYPSLQGNVTYGINGINNPPSPTNPGSGTFKTVRSAVKYLNSQGVDDPFFGGLRPIRLEIQAGYVGETDTFIEPITVLDYPRQHQNRPVVLTLATGRTDTLRIVSTINPGIIANQSVFRFSGCKYFTIDGSNGSGNRDLTVMTPSAFTAGTNKVIDIISGVNTITSTVPSTTNNTVKNCNIIGTSTISTNLNFAGVYMGGVTTPSNSLLGFNNNNSIQNNFIGAVQYGVYLRGATARADMDNSSFVSGNTIGGNNAPNVSGVTNYFGGINNAAGVFLMGQSNATVTGNTIKNNINTYLAPRGIELATIAGQYTGLDSVVRISSNIIDNIRTVSTGGAYGIYVNFGGDISNVNRGIIISNNMISGISSQGNTSTGTTFGANPYGVYLDATVNMGTITNQTVGVSLLFNSINLGVGTNLAVGNSLSACFGMPTFIRSGVVSYNNIFQNRLGGTATSTAYAVAVGGAGNPFVLSDNNDYYTAASAPTVAANFGSNVSTTPVLYNQWYEILSFTKQDTLSITSQAPFTSDNNLFIPASTSSNLYQSGKPLAGYGVDITGAGRNVFQPTIGAHEFSGSYNDNIPPRIFNVSDVTACTAGPIYIYFNIYDKQLIGDSLYYRINSGAVQNVQASFSSGTFRRYTIPAQASGTLIEYRVTAYDYPTPPNTGVYPTGKVWDTLSTGITVYPYTNSFEGVNNPIWNTLPLSGNALWEIGAMGSISSPPLGARTGIRNCLFRSSTMPVGASARLVSPCLDLTNMISPTLRFWISQNSDLPAKKDSIAVTISAGGNYWTNPLRIVQRVNDNFSLPGWAMVEVCLSQYATSGIRIGIEGYSSGTGQNILIDDIQIYDDVQAQTFTPKVFAACYSDSVRVLITNSDNRFMYRAADLSNSTLATKAGSNTNMSIGFPSPNMDTLRFFIEAINSTSISKNTGFGGGTVTCSNIMQDTVTAYINRYYNGPFITAGTPFNGTYNIGTTNNPDGAKVGDTITYRFVPPSIYLNSNYGSLWSIPTITAYVLTTGVPYTNFSFVAPSGLNSGYIRLIAPSNMFDSSIVFTFRLRINASSCDTVFNRVLRVTNPPIANFSYTPATNLCATNDIVFNALSSTKPANNYPFLFTWFFGDGTQAFVENPTKQYAAAGTYTVRFVLTDRYGLSSEKVSVITVLPSPVVNFTYITPCATDSTVFTPNTQPAGSTFLWNMPKNTTQTRQVAKYNFPKFDTAYNVTLTVTNTSGCYASITKNLFVFAKPKAGFTTAPHCLGLNVPIVDTSSIPSGNFGVSWDWGNGQISLGLQPTYKYPASGTFNAKIIVTSSFGCIDTMVKTVTVYDRPFVGYTVVNPCVGDGDMTTFTNNSTFVGGALNLDYTWNFGDNSGTFTTFSPSHLYSATTPRQVSLLAVDKVHGCRDSLTKNVNLFYKPYAQFSTAPGTSICQNNELKVVNTSYTIDAGIFTCAWSWGDGNSDVACSVNHTYTVAGSNSIKLTITTVDGCMDTATQGMQVVQGPVLTIDTTYINIQNYPYGKNNIRFTSSIKGGTYIWNMGDINNTKLYKDVVEFVFNQKGIYTVTLTVLDSNGCTVVKTITVDVCCSVGVQEQLANHFNLTAYPNPFAHTANVGFEIDKASQVKISVLDMLGRVIKVNDLGKLQSGKQTYQLDENNFGASGSYVVKVEIDGVSIYKPLIRQ